jgi:hypothetical protein
VEGGSDEASILSLRGAMDCFAEPVIGRALADLDILANVRFAPEAALHRK